MIKEERKGEREREREREKMERWRRWWKKGGVVGDEFEGNKDFSHS